MGAVMTDKHTPEPWKLCSKSYECGGDIVGPSGQSIFFGDPFKEIPDVRKYADARRIVACVNACAGMSTDVLERGNIRHVLERVFWSAPECKCSFGREATSDQSYRCAWCVVEDFLFSMINDTESETE
jgi:hypothetical protein